MIPDSSAETTPQSTQMTSLILHSTMQSSAVLTNSTSGSTGEPMEKHLEWASEEGRVSTRGDIIRWWEARRYTLNAFVFAVGFASWLLVMIAGSAAVKPGEDFVEPFAILDGAVMCIVIANACYTLTPRL